MNASEICKTFEGFHRVIRSQPRIEAAPYICPAGFWTIGWGHVCSRDHPPIDVSIGQQFLEEDLLLARLAVQRLITIPLCASQTEALTSWTFNLGSARLRASTLRARLNRNEVEAVPDEMRRWVYAGGKKLAGLVARREAEVFLFSSK